MGAPERSLDIGTCLVNGFGSTDRIVAGLVRHIKAKMEKRAYGMGATGPPAGGRRPNVQRAVWPALAVASFDVPRTGFAA